MPAGNPVINTVPSFPPLAGPLDTGRGARISLSGQTWAQPNGGRAAVPSNEQRRANAKRKLERKLERRVQRARRRRIALIAIGTIVLATAITVSIIALVTSKSGHKASSAAPATSSAPGTTSSTTSSASSASSADPAAQGGAVPPLPAFKASPDVGANCQYPASPAPAAKPAKPPRTGKVPTDPAQVSASMTTTQGNIGLLLANNESPCTVNSFVSLATQKYFDGTKCHRLTNSPSLGVLQCGDPSGNGSGGPGYQFANEYPTNQYPPDDPTAQQPVLYPRGTLAMANAGPGTDGSQFFLVYKDSQLPPQYTVFGTIQPDGLATLDKIAAAGITAGATDGPPVADVTIKTLLPD